MRLLVVAGLTPPMSKRLRGEVKRSGMLRSGWVLETIDSKNQRMHSITSEQGMDAMRMASASENAHIIGVSTEAGQARQRLSSLIRSFFRFRWLDNRLLESLNSNAREFISSLNKVLEEEEYWAENIKPTGVADALILPKQSFRTRAPHSNLWEECEAYGNRAIAAAFVRHLEAFRQAYNKRSMGEGNKFVHWWTDDDDLVFKHRGAPHGIAPFPRDWKYSMKLAAGFHYDVQSGKNRPYGVIDSSGETHRRAGDKHVNLDAHGYVRGSSS